MPERAWQTTPLDYGQHTPNHIPLCWNEALDKPRWIDDQCDAEACDRKMPLLAHFVAGSLSHPCCYQCIHPQD